ncbi:MAG: hypothetical protein JOZ08_14990 [Verrucomicrobia bacterium]|nr:hypothetical protein [Verrucomicrobiota bacterium]
MAACERAGFVPHIAQEAVQMETIVNLVACGLGVALAPTSFRTPERRDVVFLAIHGPGAPVGYARVVRIQKTEVELPQRRRNL